MKNVIERIFAISVSVLVIPIILFGVGTTVTGIQLANTQNAIGWLTNRGYTIASPGINISVDVIPATNNTYVLGNTTRLWKQADMNQLNVNNVSGFTAEGNIAPDADVSHNIGSATRWWKNLFAQTIQGITGLFATLNATQINAPTVNVTQNITTANFTVSRNATVSNITGTQNASFAYLTATNITARDATVIVATSAASAAEKSIANFVLPGANDEVTLLLAFNALPNHGGLAVNTKTGTLKLIGSGNVNLGALLDFPPMQDGIIDLHSAANINGAGVRFDSLMDCIIKLPVLSGSTNSTILSFYPRTAGPDGGINGQANEWELRSLAISGAYIGISVNDSAALPQQNRFICYETLCNTPVQASAAVNASNYFFYQNYSNTIFANAQTQTKIVQVSFNASATANGTSNITSLSFRPTYIEVWASTNASADVHSISYYDGTGTFYMQRDSTGASYGRTGLLGNLNMGGGATVTISMGAIHNTGASYILTITGPPNVYCVLTFIFKR